MDQEYHQMVLEEVHPSGEETWNCPTCGRRLSVIWEPKFKKRVLAHGDENAAHAGSKGSLQIESTKVPDAAGGFVSEPHTSLEDPSLAPWAVWLDEVGFENLWDDEI
jgi:hypothetical protein